nr:aldehyde dehydrogenase family protein [Pseudomonas sp. MWU15-20650]
MTRGHGCVRRRYERRVERCLSTANGVQAGRVRINAPQVIFPQTAWGGYKPSSIGRALGPWGLAAFQEIKHVIRST